MKVTTKTRKSHYWNEDRFIIGKDFFMVIDGATPLIKSPHLNEACWMVNYIKKNISKCSGLISDRLLKLAKDGFYDLPTTKNEDNIPSASASWVEYDDTYFYAYALGDCEVTFITTDSQIVRLHSPALNRLDTIALQQMVAIAKEKNIHNLDARKYISDTLIRHRKMINKPNGYTAFTLSPTPTLTPKTMKIERKKVKTIYLYSDGFSQAYEHLCIYNSHTEMFSNELEIAEEIKKIEKASFADPYCDTYPRFKIIDDITAIKIENDLKTN
ncbi:MAG: hypothetical protein E7350_03745 [Clostridiales bacterium]|nr:hypothetical protein [Clostridiales bacterium]